ncbi:uncharacterized protein [Euwallacea fornicatus]|uniref:uncharacterized protein isoform X2 n=1 Tax=Euwallacea fornicatus TaxID=995702 RepID=UPI00338F28FD
MGGDDFCANLCPGSGSRGKARANRNLNAGNNGRRVGPISKQPTGTSSLFQKNVVTTDSSSPSAKPPGRARREPRPPRDSEPPPPYVAEPEDKIRNVLNGIRNKAETYKNEIRAFDERSDNNKFYHIDENLKKLVDALDDMRQQVAGNDVLLRDRNEVYEYIFHLLGELDKKLEENKRTFQENKQKTIFVTI